METNQEQTPDKPMDIENDPRYLEILDEEAKKYDEISYDSMIGNLVNRRTSLGLQIVQLSVKLSAQRRYFSELLQEKEKELKQTNELLDKVSNTNWELQNQLSEAKATILRLKNQ